MNDHKFLEFVRLPHAQFEVSQPVKISTDSTKPENGKFEVVDPFPSVEEFRQYRPLKNKQDQRFKAN